MILLYWVPIYIWCLLSPVYATVSKSNYNRDDEIPILVTNISPGGNGENGLFHLYPVSYFEEATDFCYADKWVDENEPSFDNQKYKTISNVFKSDTIFNDHIYYGPRTIISKFQQDIQCDQMCWRSYATANASQINFLIENDYRLNFYIDDMPIGKEFYDYNSNKFYLSNNVPIGYSDVNKVLHIYNHWQFVIYYTNTGLNNYNIIKAVMQQRSTKRSKESENQCQVFPPMTLRLKSDVDNKVIFTYEIVWKEVDHEVTNHYDWSNRFDQYRHSLVNYKYDNIQNTLNFVLVLFIALYSRSKFSSIINDADMKSYKAVSSSPLAEETVDDEFLLDWHSLKNDVFRKPCNLVLFSNLVGFGFQFLLTSTLILSLLILNIISILIPNDVKHKFFEFAILTSGIQSYVSSTVYKNFHPSYSKKNSATNTLKDHKKIIVVNAIFTPIVFLVISTVLNLAYKSANSSKYLGFDVFMKIVKKFLFLYFPLSLSGSLYSLKFSKTNFFNENVNVNIIEKQIPSSVPVFNRPVITSLVVAIFPFTIVCTRLDSLWYSILFNNFYFGFWNYLICVFLACIVSAAINMTMVFDSLNAGDWKWHWLSVKSGLTVALYCFVYSFKVVGWNKFGDKQSFLIFVCQNFLVSFLIGAGFASINFYFAWVSVKRLYKA